MSGCGHLIAGERVSSGHGNKNLQSWALFQDLKVTMQRMRGGNILYAATNDALPLELSRGQDGSFFAVHSTTEH
jgi:hypothetical protein